MECACDVWCPGGQSSDGKPMAKTPKAVAMSTILTSAPLPKELGGRGGLEPTRYGDWEKKGIAVDF